jgi:inositol-1,4,5-trisphosphate 5-phosphatase
MKVDKQAVGGFGGMIGRKKGAVAMYINFSGIRMVFVSCHLAGWFSFHVYAFVSVTCF